MMFRLFISFSVAIAGLFSPFSRVDAEVIPHQRLAILIGVQSYPNLPLSQRLDGCVNDAQAMKRLLIDQFKFEENDIQMVLEESATADGIRKSMNEVLSRIENSTRLNLPIQFVFHFSGHGSQTADQAQGEDRDETDGLDETLVPYDAHSQGSTNDIRDDEIHAFISKIATHPQSHVWMILDCCHSGTGLRGAMKTRKLEREHLIPTVSNDIHRRTLPRGVVALMACRDNEVEPEYQDGDQQHGLLTFHLIESLSSRSSLDRLTYAGLRQSLEARYLHNVKIVSPPVPQLEGDPDTLMSPLLSGGGNPQPPAWSCFTEGTVEKVIRLRAGSLHGLTVGSIFEVYRSPDEIEFSQAKSIDQRSGKSLGWLKIFSVSGATSTANFVSWDKEQTPKQELVPADFTKGWVIERYHHPSQSKLNLFLDAPSQETDAPSVASIALVESFLGMPDAKNWIEPVSEVERADVLLRIVNGKWALFPSQSASHANAKDAIKMDDESDKSTSIDSNIGRAWGPYDLDTLQTARSESHLLDHLKAVARSRNLIRIASSVNTSSNNTPKVKLELVRIDPDSGQISAWSNLYLPPRSSIFDTASPTGIGSELGRPWMKTGDAFAFRITNLATEDEATTKPIHIAVLLIEEESMAIKQVLPYQASDGSISLDETVLAPGATITTTGWICNGESIQGTDTPRYGRRFAVLLATQEPNQFYMLSQPSLPRVRGQSIDRIIDPSQQRGTESEENCPISSLETLLLQDVFFVERGKRRERPKSLYDDSWNAALLAWDVIPDSERKR